MVYRFIALILIVCSTVGCNNNGGELRYKTSKIDTADMFFSGEFYSTDGIRYFKDCATSKVMNFNAKNIDQIEDLYISTAKGNPSYCMFRGEYNAERSMVTSNDFIGFNIDENCMPIKLNKTYASQTEDTLNLTENYKYTLKTKNSKELSGNWGRLYKDSGVLILHDGFGIIFTLNIGLKSDNNNLFLSMEGTDGKGVIFLPI